VNESDKLKMQFINAAHDAKTPQDIQDAVYSLSSGAWGKIADFIIDYCAEKGIDKHAPEVAAFYQEAEESRAREAREQKEKAAADLAGQIANYQKNISAGVRLDDPGLVALTGEIGKNAAALGGASNERDRRGTWATFLQECVIYEPDKQFSPVLFAGLAFPESSVSYIGARTTRGKTSMMVNLAREAISAERKTVFITLEESRRQILTRLALSLAFSLAIKNDPPHDPANRRELLSRTKPRTDYYNLLKGKDTAGPGAAAFVSFVSAANELLKKAYGNILVVYDGRGAKFNEIINEIKQSGAGTLVLLDYIQRMPDSPGNETDTYMRVKRISDGIVNAGVTTNCIIISGAQFNRAGGAHTEIKHDKEKKYPDVFSDSSYRESGDIEQDAHNAIGIGWEADKETRFIEILKTREDSGNGKQYRLDFAGGYSFMANLGKRETLQGESPEGQDKTEEKTIRGGR
jgi:hypothetical protein